MELSGRLRNHLEAPKNPSATPRPTFQLRVEPFIVRQAGVESPKRPSIGHRPESQLRVENVTGRHSHLEAPKNLSATPRPESELQETRRARLAHIEIPKDPSMIRLSNQSFQRTLQRTPDLLQESEESISKALSRFRGLREQSGKLLDAFKVPKNPSRINRLTFRLSWSTSANHRRLHGSEEPL